MEARRGDRVWLRCLHRVLVILEMVGAHRVVLSARKSLNRVRALARQDFAHYRVIRCRFTDFCLDRLGLHGEFEEDSLRRLVFAEFSNGFSRLSLK